MAIKFSCPSCGVILSASDSARGKNVTCPKCKNQFTISTAQEAQAEPEEALEEALPAKRPRHEMARAPRKSASWETKRGKLIAYIIIATALFIGFIGYLIGGGMGPSK
jgi:uncharacterized Zn finger protein (UPF0148 family)